MYTNLDSYNNKRSELLVRIAQHQPDVIGLTEITPKHATWKLLMEDMMIQGYTAYVNFEGGGVALYIRDEIRPEEIKHATLYSPAVWSSITLKNQDKLLIGVIYRSPSSTDLDNTNLLAMITEMVNEQSSHLMIMGDFNYPGIDWEKAVSSGSAVEQGFLDTYRDCFLWQHVTQPTRYRALQSANILDLVMTNEEGMIQEVEYNEPVGKSDHLVLNWTYNSYIEQSRKVTVKRLYNDGNYENMRADLGGTDWANLLQDKTVDEQWNIIRTRILDSVSTHIPQKILYQVAPLSVASHYG
jgi:exonuclease III